MNDQPHTGHHSTLPDLIPRLDVNILKFVFFFLLIFEFTPEIHGIYPCLDTLNMDIIQVRASLYVAYIVIQCWE